MALVLSDTFSGSGSIHGHGPDTGAGTWSSTGDGSSWFEVFLSGGYAVCPDLSETYNTGRASYPGDTSLGLTTSAGYTLTLVSKVVSLDDEGDAYLIALAQTSTGGSVELMLNRYTNDYVVYKWGLMLRARMDDMSSYTWATEVDVTAGVTAGDQTVTLVLAAGVYTLTGYGHSLTITPTVPATLDKVLVQVRCQNKLASLALDGTAAAATPTARLSASGPLRAPALLASVGYATRSARLSMASPLGAPAVRANHDFTRLLGDVISVYVMDLITPTGRVRVPISSWQATLQTGASNYVQCVVPGCTVWAAAINAATEFAISRRAVLPGGQAVEVEMARAPAETAIFDQGPSRYTCTLSGYSTAFGANTDPAAAYDRTLTGVRSVSSGTTRRVRCAVDWLLRPGQRCFVQGTPMLVGYINYYAPTGFDSYMDVGEQA